MIPCVCGHASIVHDERAASPCALCGCHTFRSREKPQQGAPEEGEKPTALTVTRSADAGGAPSCGSRDGSSTAEHSAVARDTLVQLQPVTPEPEEEARGKLSAGINPLSDNPPRASSSDSPELLAIRQRSRWWPGHKPEVYADAATLLRIVDELTQENETWRYAVCGNDGWMQDVAELRKVRDGLREKLAEAAQAIGTLKVFLAAEMKRAELKEKRAEAALVEAESARDRKTLDLAEALSDLERERTFSARMSRELEQAQVRAETAEARVRELESRSRDRSGKEAR